MGLDDFTLFLHEANLLEDDTSATGDTEFAIREVRRATRSKQYPCPCNEQETKPSDSYPSPYDSLHCEPQSIISIARHLSTYSTQHSLDVTCVSAFVCGAGALGFHPVGDDRARRAAPEVNAQVADVGGVFRSYFQSGRHEARVVLLGDMSMGWSLEY